MVIHTHTHAGHEELTNIVQINHLARKTLDGKKLKSLKSVRKIALLVRNYNIYNLKIIIYMHIYILQPRDSTVYLLIYPLKTGTCTVYIQ